jgi:hypothetical protein
MVRVEGDHGGSVIPHLQIRRSIRVVDVPVELQMRGGNAKLGATSPVESDDGLSAKPPGDLFV